VKKRLLRLVPRYSLRTLAVFMLLCTSGFGLWWHWEPWVMVADIRLRSGDCIGNLAYSPDGKTLAVVTRTLSGCGEAGPPTPKAFCACTGRALPEHSSLEQTERPDEWGMRGRPLLSSDDERKVKSLVDARSEVILDTVTGKLLCTLPRVTPFMFESWKAFSPDGEGLAIGSWGTCTVFRRRRPEWWWGVFYLWEFWLTVAFAGVFVWSAVRDRRRLARTG